MKKRVLAAVLGATMLLGALTGCSKSKTDDKANSDKSNTTAVAPAEDSATETTGSGQTIKVWIPPYAKSDAELTDQMFWDQQFDAFEEETGCTVQVEVLPWEGYKQKITTGLISNDGPDVVYIDTPYDLVESGAFEPLDDYFTEEEVDNYIYWNLGQIQNKQYVAPMLVGNASVLYCNMDILNAAGFDRPPETWDELIEYSLKIKEVMPDVQPFLQNWGSKTKGALVVSWLPYYWQTGASFLDAEGKPAINNEGGLQTVEFLKKLQDVGIFDETITAAENPRDVFRAGEVAMYVGDTGSAKKTTEAGINWEVNPALTGPNGDRATWIAADSLAISANSKNKELAVAALKYMMSEKVMDAFHEQMYAMCPITKDAKFYDDERFQTMYLEQSELFHNWPMFENSDAFWDYLLKNMQSMYMGELTPQQVLDDTMQQYADFVS